MTSTRSRLPLALVNLVAFVSVIVVNALSTTIPLGGMSPGQLSDLYPNLFVPAGLTFSIWGVIYILLAIYVVYSLIFSVRKADLDRTFMEKSAALFLITCLANIGWIFSWQYRVLLLSLVCMVVLLLMLIAAYVRLGVGNSKARAVEKYMVHLPFSVYFGWISIATIANGTALLVNYKWQRFGLSESFWAILMIAIGVVLGLVFLLSRKDIFYTLVIDWAVLGILLKRTAVGGAEGQGVVVAAIIGICVLSLGILVQVIRRKIYR
jgi:hypothetical protein